MYGLMYYLHVCKVEARLHSTYMTTVFPKIVVLADK